MLGRRSSKDATERQLRHLGREDWVLELRRMKMLLDVKYHY